MLYLVILALSVPAGEILALPGQDSQAPPTKPCCKTGVWSAQLFTLDDDQHFLRYATDFAVDEVNGIETTYVEDRITGQLVERMHVDYKKQISYTVLYYGDQKGQCQTSKPAHKFWSSCDTPMPGKANMTSVKYLGNGTLGGSLLYDAWSIQYEQELNITITLARDTCLPVLEKVNNINTSPLAHPVLMFNNAKLSAPMGYFDIPPECVSGVVG